MGYGGVTIESSEECRPQKVILEKPSVEIEVVVSAFTGGLSKT